MGDYIREIQEEKRTRQYIVHTPTGYNKNKKKWPVVMVLHGGGSNATQMAYMSKFHDLADSTGKFIVVYPNGIINGAPANNIRTWNALTCCGFSTILNIDDIDFLKDIVRNLGEWNPDYRRIYCTGFSNGGMMTHVMGLSTIGIFAAIAPCSGDVPLSISSISSKHKIPVMYVQGKEDPHMLYEGGTGDPPPFGGPGHTARSYEEGFGLWLAANNCVTDTPAEQFDFDWGSLITFQNKKKEVNSSVVAFVLDHLGHQWSGGGDLDEGEFGPYLSTPDQTAIIWEFFEQFALPATSPGGGPKPQKNPPKPC